MLTLLKKFFVVCSLFLVVPHFALAQTTPLIFTDVPLKVWFNSYVYQAVNLGFVSGYTDEFGRLTGKFGPEDQITAAQLVKIGYGLADAKLKLTEPACDTSLLNIIKTDWSCSYFSFAEDHEVALMNEINLDPNRHVTRAEAVDTLMTLAFVDYQLPGVLHTDGGFTDVSEYHRYYDSLNLAANMGVIAGDANTGNFRPDQPINRAEVAKIAVEIAGYKAEL